MHCGLFLVSISELTRKEVTLRLSETKQLKFSTADNIFFLYLIVIKLCTLKQLENIHQKLKLKFFITVVVSMATIQQK